MKFGKQLEASTQNWQNLELLIKKKRVVIFVIYTLFYKNSGASNCKKVKNKLRLGLKRVFGLAAGRPIS